MSESPPPPVPGHAAEGRPDPLTPDAIDRLLADFRGWLTDLASREPQPPEEKLLREPPDLHTLLGQMIAVRQEVNLQTRAVRAQQELNTESLQLLEAALEELRKGRNAAQQQQTSPDDLLRPLLKTLLDIHDSLSLALREALRIQEASEKPEPGPSSLRTVNIPPLEQPSRSWLARLFGGKGFPDSNLTAWKAQVQAAYEKRAAESVEAIRLHTQQGGERQAQLLESLVAGYRMGLQRIERALQQHGLEAIPATGENFDPERMEVLEAVAGSGQPAGEVLEEVRRGYLWRGRVFRFAQVRVARS